MIDLAKYKALTPESYSFMNYSLEEIFQNIMALKTNSQQIWDSLK